MLALLAPLPAALALPDAPHSSAEWKIAAYSSAAPAEIAAGATIYDNDGKTVLRAGTNAWSCMPANPKGPDADGAYSSAHKAMPFCFDAEGYKWVVGFMTDTASGPLADPSGSTSIGVPMAGVCLAIFLASSETSPVIARTSMTSPTGTAAISNRSGRTVTTWYS